MWQLEQPRPVWRCKTGTRITPGQAGVCNTDGPPLPFDDLSLFRDLQTGLVATTSEASLTVNTAPNTSPGVASTTSLTGCSIHHEQTTPCQAGPCVHMRHHHIHFRCCWVTTWVIQQTKHMNKQDSSQFASQHPAPGQHASMRHHQTRSGLVTHSMQCKALEVYVPQLSTLFVKLISIAISLRNFTWATNLVLMPLRLCPAFFDGMPSPTAPASPAGGSLAELLLPCLPTHLGSSPRMQVACKAATAVEQDENRAGDDPTSGRFYPDAVPAWAAQAAGDD